MSPILGVVTAWSSYSLDLLPQSFICIQCCCSCDSRTPSLPSHGHQRRRLQTHHRFAVRFQRITCACDGIPSIASVACSSMLVLLPTRSRASPLLDLNLADSVLVLTHKDEFLLSSMLLVKRDYILVQNLGSVGVSDFGLQGCLALLDRRPAHLWSGLMVLSLSGRWGWADTMV
ncbi:hypothetical protein AAHA92_21521 [Salvia divinorum]|uniref:Uncharacterized protein n=1 Tax=Salvia divinorum TaxID=28513 RepID=A0ABD1GNR9_SALDI